MNAVHWYSEIEPQFNYRHDFIGCLHSAEPENDRDMQDICQGHAILDQK